MKRSLATAAVLACALASTVQANPLERALRGLEPEDRANQVCALRGVELIRRDKRLPQVDRIKTGIKGRPTYTGTHVDSSAGAVRAKDGWYSLSFKCVVTDDQMAATEFTYEIGAKIPEDSWEQYGLWR